MRVPRLTWPLVLGGLLFAMLLVTRLQLPAVHLDTVRLSLGPPPAISERGRQLDETLRSNLSVFRRQPELVTAIDIPPREAVLPSFWIDSCEVQQGTLEQFLTRQSSQAGTRYHTTSKGHRVAGRARAPASGVSYFEAAAYCRTVGGELPSAEQWLAAAGGSTGRLYPWGDRFEAIAWPYAMAVLNSGQKCGLHSDSDTPQGVHDLANGVEEWSRGWIDDRTPLLHGVHAQLGKRALAVHALNATTRSAPPSYRSHYTGFRCVYSRRPPPLAWKERAEVVRIPGGSYRFGLPSDARLPRLLSVLPRDQLHIDEPLFRSEQPALSELRVASCEVSRRHYRLFLVDPLVRLGLFANENEPQDQSYRPQDWERQLLAPTLPVSGIDWWSADAFARWAGGRLPSAYEWQLALGDDYPWGANYKPGHAVTGDGQEPRRLACAELTAGATKGGLLGMGGNVSEWTRSVFVAGRAYRMLVKGGNYLLPGAQTAHGDFARAVPLDHRAPDIGLRLVFD